MQKVPYIQTTVAQKKHPLQDLNKPFNSYLPLMHENCKKHCLYPWFPNDIKGDRKYPKKPQLLGILAEFQKQINPRTVETLI